jgi:hypothetical protein
VQFLAVTVTQAVLKNIGFDPEIWSLACVTHCQVVSISYIDFLRQQFPAPTLPEKTLVGVNSPKDFPGRGLQIFLHSKRGPAGSTDCSFATWREHNEAVS